jgi:hypothetical protein
VHQGLCRHLQGWQRLLENKRDGGVRLWGKGPQENGNLCHHQERETGENTDNQCHLNSKKMVLTPALIASVTTAVEEDR